MSSQKLSLVCSNNSKRGEYKCRQKQQLKFYLPSCQFNITTTFCETLTTTTTLALIKARNILSKCSCWKQSPIAKLVNFNMLLLKNKILRWSFNVLLLWTKSQPWCSLHWCTPGENKAPGSMASWAVPTCTKIVLHLLTCVISCVRISISCSSSTSSNMSGRVECFSCSWPSSCTGRGGGER